MMLKLNFKDPLNSGKYSLPNQFQTPFLIHHESHQDQFSTEKIVGNN